MQVLVHLPSGRVLELFAEEGRSRETGQLTISTIVHNDDLGDGRDFLTYLKELHLLRAVSCYPTHYT